MLFHDKKNDENPLENPQRTMPPKNTITTEGINKKKLRTTI